MNFPSIQIEPQVLSCCPALRLGLLRAELSSGSVELQAFLRAELRSWQEKTTLGELQKQPPLAATRRAYKALGKDPSRYRPSAEALQRRVLQGKGLYQISPVVDLLNLISVQSGFSIGGYDLAKISGAVNLGRGRPSEPYQAIGRGALNIAGLPVLRDEKGAFGTPTSDSQRTMTSPATEQILAVFFDFEKDENLEPTLQKFADWLHRFAAAKKTATRLTI